MGLDPEEELEERLSRPLAADVAAMKSLAGDLLVLGAGGKMGPSLVRRARRAVQEAGTNTRVIAVARFSQGGLARELTSEGIEVITSDLLERGALQRLPDAPHVIFMAARKFGTSGSAHLTWAMNTYLPGLVAERYCQARIVAFSSGSIYPLLPVTPEGGASEASHSRSGWASTHSRCWGGSECSSTGRTSGAHRYACCG